MCRGPALSGRRPLNPITSLFRGRRNWYKHGTSHDARRSKTKAFRAFACGDVQDHVYVRRSRRPGRLIWPPWTPSGFSRRAEDVPRRGSGPVQETNL